MRPNEDNFLIFFEFTLLFCLLWWKKLVDPIYVLLMPIRSSWILVFRSDPSSDVEIVYYRNTDINLNSTLWIVQFHLNNLKYSLFCLCAYLKKLNEVFYLADIIWLFLLLVSRKIFCKIISHYKLSHFFKMKKNLPIRKNQYYFNQYQITKILFSNKIFQYCSVAKPKVTVQLTNEIQEESDLKQYKKLNKHSTIVLSQDKQNAILKCIKGKIFIIFKFLQ